MAFGLGFMSIAVRSIFNEFNEDEPFICVVMEKSIDKVGL